MNAYTHVCPHSCIHMYIHTHKLTRIHLSVYTDTYVRLKNSQNDFIKKFIIACVNQRKWKHNKKNSTYCCVQHCRKYDLFFSTLLLILLCFFGSLEINQKTISTMERCSILLKNEIGDRMLADEKKEKEIQSDNQTLDIEKKKQTHLIWTKPVLSSDLYSQMHSEQ